MCACVHARACVRPPCHAPLQFSSVAELAGRDDGDGRDFCVGCFADSNSPAAMFVARQALNLRDRGDASPARVVILDVAVAEVAPKVAELGVVVTPALCFLYNGRPLTVRRPGFTDGVLCA
jgi:hypothetical protein